MAFTGPGHPYEAGGYVRFGGSGDTYQVQDDGSLRSMTNGQRGSVKRRRREARLRREVELMSQRKGIKERPGGSDAGRAASLVGEGRGDALPAGEPVRPGVEGASLDPGTTSREAPAT